MKMLHKKCKDTQYSAVWKIRTFAGVWTLPADKDVLAGIGTLADLMSAGKIVTVRGNLAERDDRLQGLEEPTCLEEEIPLYHRAGGEEEGLSKKEAPVKERDHAIDALRYLCHTRGAEVVTQTHSATCKACGCEFEPRSALHAYCSQKCRSKRWSKSGGDFARWSTYFQRNYPHVFNEQREFQGHRCAICGQKGKLALDHDHSTGRLRGYLCAHCNLGLGSFRDEPARLLAAVEYLKNPPWRIRYEAKVGA